MSESKRVVVPNVIMIGAVIDLLKEGKTVCIPANGNSMSPFIRHAKDSVELESPKGGISVGDIVLAEIRYDVYVLHRVKAVSGDKVTLKGDGNLDCEEHCHVSDVSGRAVRIIKPGRRGFDCNSRSFIRMSALWCSAPRIVRRICLAIYRRVKIL